MIWGGCYLQDGAKLGPSWPILGPSWAEVGILTPSWPFEGLQDEGKLGQDEAKLGEVAIFSHLRGNLAATWPNMADKMATWRQLGGNGSVLGPSWGLLGALLGPS